MRERNVTDGSKTSDPQWGADWFFRKEGNKTSIDTSLLKWMGGAAVLTFAAIQFTDTNTSPTSSASKSEFIGVSGSGASALKNSEIPFAEEGKSTATRSDVPSGRAGKKLAGPQLIARPRNLSAIPPGSQMKALLVSGASNGLVKAQIEEPLTVNGDVILESGSSLVGQGTSTEERLLISFHQVVFRDGTYGNIQAEACDIDDKTVGLKGSKLGTKTLNVVGSIGLGFVGGLAEGFQDAQGQQGAVVRPPTGRNAMLNATATTALEQSRNLMSGIKESKPTIEVPAGTPICILFSGGGQ